MHDFVTEYCVFSCSSDVFYLFFILFFFKQKTAYEIRISDWSSDVCSSDLSDQHLTINAGVRSAVYKVYTPDFVKQNEKNFLNNPFKNEYIFDLHAASLATKKGRTVALGTTTDVIAVLKSLQNLYQTLD